MLDQNRPTRVPADAVLTPHKREEIVRRYWLNGDLTPLAVANALAGQRVAEAA